MIRLSIQDRLLPGEDIAAKWEAAQRYGFDAIELQALPIEEAAGEAKAAGIPISAICAGYRGWLIDPDPQQVNLARRDIKRLLEVGAAVGAGCIVIPIYGRTRNLPGNGTGRSPAGDEALFLEGMRELASHAERVAGTLHLEAINRYENDVCVRVADSIRLRDAIGSPAVRVMGDVFHMNIEEDDFAAAFEAAGERLGYVHLADSQRLEPGQGHLDFDSVFRGLARIAYDGYASMECGLSGPPDEVLPRAVEYVRARIADARPAA
ncbi:MAG TPA: sugar phosphate isomerase/epimerase family protein [Candidatus Limnocylindrales bacterium]|jgi:sugar phosphate isomerase/epimerase|nr:sugar phosphate isomerase/epimerase family protein [Candidatus Limnocylindrales bacterium]